MLSKKYGDGIVLRCYTDYERMLSEITDASIPEPDIVISDIMLGDKNGCFEAKKISRALPYAKIIFLTGYPELVADIFSSVRPSNILLKPVDSGRLTEAVEKAFRESLDDKGRRIYIVTHQKTERLFRYGDIVYAESIGRRLTLHTLSGEFAFYHKLVDFIGETDGYFVRCHQSYAVNLRRVTELHAASALMDDGSEVSVSRAYYAALRDALLGLL